MSDQPSPPGPKRVRSQTYRTFHPDQLIVGLVSAPPLKRIDIVLQNEDTAPFPQGDVSPIVMDEARVVMRPDVALGMARLIVKALNAYIQDDPEQARAFGVTAEILRDLSDSEFGSKANE